MQASCIIIPCYQEAKRLNTAAFLSYAAKHPEICFCFVNDGSPDNTLELLRSMEKEGKGNISVIDQQPNKGKAEAVRTGMLQMQSSGKFSWLGYWDADLATPLEEIKHFLEEHERYGGEAKYCLGSRWKRLGSSIERSSKRHILGRVFSTCASWILGLPVYDSQCGAKLIASDLVPLLFKDPFISRWLFDVEILARLRNEYGVEKTLQLCLEIGLRTWKEIPGSKLPFSYFFKVPLELLRIKRHYKK